MKCFNAIPPLLLSLFVVACDQPEPTTYTIPKEERGAPLPAQMPATDPQKMEILPGMSEAAEEAPELSYTVPEGWEEFPPQSIRKANFRVSDESGSAEIAVTVFPGDVGGMLANINRWRGQIGLPPITEDRIGDLTSPIVISKHRGTLVTLNGSEQSVFGGILPFHGSTWFFKMQGSTGTVTAQSAAMESFLGSVSIEDHHHH